MAPHNGSNGAFVPVDAGGDDGAARRAEEGGTQASGNASRSGRDGLVDVDARGVLADDVADVLACAGLL